MDLEDDQEIQIIRKKLEELNVTISISKLYSLINFIFKTVSMWF